MKYSNAYEYLIQNAETSSFSVDEWPRPEDLKFVKSEVIQLLDITRKRFGHPVYPSQNPDGLVRRSGSKTSRHYIGDGSMGQAVDVFPSKNVLDFWLCAVEIPSWTGIGLYLDTNINRIQPQPMIHLDIGARPARAFWVRDRNGKYIYKSQSSKDFWKNLSEAVDKI